MPDFQDFSVTPQGAANLNVPTHRIAGRIIDSETGAPIGDFTGPNAVNWPSVLATLTIEQQQQIADQLAQQLLYWKAGM